MYVYHYLLTKTVFEALIFTYFLLQYFSMVGYYADFYFPLTALNNYQAELTIMILGLNLNR